MQGSRQVLVPPERLAGWVHRFGERNGPFTIHAVGAAVVLEAANSCVAEIVPPLEGSATGTTASSGRDHGPERRRLSPEEAVAGLVARASVGSTVGLILVRRGGYAVGIARSGKLLASKTGTRYVQSRTAAGGWSQQRFARRRANQADALVDTAAERAALLFNQHGPDCLQPGGDAQLVADSLATGHLAPYRNLPRLPLLAVADPRQDVLRQAATDSCALRISLRGIPAV